MCINTNVPLQTDMFNNIFCDNKNGGGYKSVHDFKYFNVSWQYGFSLIIIINILTLPYVIRA